MTDYDVIVIGAGHNGLAAATVLAKEGLKVLSLEQQRWVGGFAGTAEYFPGFKHNVGAWALMVCRQEMIDTLELYEYGLEIIDTPMSSHVIGEKGDTPYILYNDTEETMAHILNDHGEDALQCLTALYEMGTVFARATDPTRYTAPKSASAVIDGMPDNRSRDIMRKWLYGSAIDIIDEVFPDPSKHKLMRGSLAAMAIDGTDLGPYSPGTALSLAYHITAAGDDITFKQPKGGMGMFSEALRRSLEKKGGEVRLNTRVKKVLVENGKAQGVELNNGETITAKVVLSNADAHATFLKMVGEKNLPSDFVHQVRGIKYTDPYIQIHVTLSELPEFEGDLAYANEGPLRAMMAYIPSPELLEKCWDACKWGRVPENPVNYCYIPSFFDETLAPEGCHTATFFAPYFPVHAPPKKHAELKKEMTDKIIGQWTQRAPNLKDAIIDQAVFIPSTFEKMLGITGGCLSHGVIHFDHMLDLRPVVGWSPGYKTPIKDLYLCSCACHPGSGVTAVPGYNCANEVLKNY